MTLQTIFKISFILCLTLLVIFAGLMFQSIWDVMAIDIYIKSYGLLASVIFILLYAFATILLLPAAFMAFIGGYVFGFSHGILVNIIGSSLGVGSAFLIGRYIGADWVRNRLGKRSVDIVDGVERMGWKFVALFRLTPFVPFDILNFALGITSITVWRYMLASVTFMLPGMITYTYLGKIGLDIILGQPKFLFIKGIIAVGILLGLLLIIPKISVKMKNKFFLRSI